MNKIDGGFLINLETRRERLASARAVVAKLAFPFRVETFRAIDGATILNAGGRLYKGPLQGSGSMEWKITFAGKEGVRESHLMRPSKLTKGRVENPWSRFGCLRSYRECLQLGIDRGWTRWLVLEDDVVASEGASEQIELALKKLNKSRPSWTMLLLGGAPLGGFKAPLTNNSSAFLGHKLARAECVFQAHAYVVSSSCAQVLVRKLDEGFGADSATTAFQRSVWSSGEGGAYWLR